MFWMDNPSGVPAMPPLQAVHSATKLWFTEGGNGQPVSYPGADWFNIVSAELLGVLDQAGIVPVKSDMGQLAKAIQSIAFSAYPVGSPIPWPLATPPSGFLILMGQSFSAVMYPKLALAYPALTLPDMRAEFLRGWDNGRGIDTGRSLLSAQADSLKSHNHGYGLYEFTPPPNSGYPLPAPSTTHGGATKYVAVENTNFGGAETRPRNIAFNYIVRAA